MGAILAVAAATTGFADNAAAPSGAILPALQPTLKIGDPAPPLAVMAWIRGEPVTQFRPGHVYIVDFWATWCSVCIEGMLHLSALQRKYDGKLTVIGVDSREMARAVGSIDPAAVQAKVEASARRHAERMIYTVAMDHPVEEPVYKAWQVASGGMRVPNAMIVDGNGVIVWNAPPGGKWRDKFDAAVAAAVSGASDLALGRAVFDEQYGEGMISLRFHHRFVNLLQTDEAAAMDYVRAAAQEPQLRAALGESGADPFYWGMLGLVMSAQQALSPRLSRLAAGYVEELVAYRPNVPAWYLGLAGLHYRAGEHGKGAAAEKTALRMFRESGMSDEQLAQVAGTLDRFREK
jgi:thiol-disulfide isomerase/thioredoxin